MRLSALRLPKMQLKIGISVFFFGVVVVFCSPDMALPCILAAAFHECGHLLFAKLLGIPLSEMKLDLFGAHISVSAGLISYRSEFWLCAAGPLFSFLLTFVLFYPHRAIGAFWESLGEASLFLGCFNLLPVRGFDGGRMLTVTLSAIFSPTVADTAEKFFTGIFLILLWLIAVYLLLITGGGLSLFIFSIGLFCKIFLS